MPAVLRTLAIMLSGVAAASAQTTIPTIDLAGEPSRQVIVDREEGQYLGHVTTVLLEDGRTILAVYPKGHGRGAIILKRSDDGGRTWTPLKPVGDWGGVVTMGSVVRLRNGNYLSSRCGSRSRSWTGG